MCKYTTLFTVYTFLILVILCFKCMLYTWPSRITAVITEFSGGVTEKKKKSNFCTLSLVLNKLQKISSEAIQKIFLYVTLSNFFSRPLCLMPFTKSDYENYGR